ncbi:MAG TPA: fluoride efflux transporter CrcB [Acidimicrobiia bacterium]|nr:fluoride efflux transporter CrcB [Acidimicrobiia bacterium]
MILLGVLAAGALGAPARYLLEQAVRRAGQVFPWGTLVVNLSGSFAIGLVTGAALAQGFSPDARAVIGVGFLGAYTTFSTYAYEIVRAAESGEVRVATLYALSSLILGVGLAAAGLAVTGAL